MQHTSTIYAIRSSSIKQVFFAALLLFGTYLHSTAQWVAIPDTNFGTWLNVNGYTSCMQGSNSVGWQMDTTCLALANASNINCSASNISSVEGLQYFKNIVELNCSENDIANLPTLVNSLRYINCTYNRITSLSALPTALLRLLCYQNQLTVLPTLPNALTRLICGNNQLTTLPTLPASLLILDAGGNSLGDLPMLPAGLNTLACSFNQLFTLPTLPSTLYSLNCSNNLLYSLPELPDSLAYFSCSYNPNLYCLPELKKIREFFYLETGITCLPSFPQLNEASFPPLSTYPLCNVSGFNVYECGTNWSIKGNVFTDNVVNCNYDLQERGAPNVKIMVFKNGNLYRQTYSLLDGSYTLNLNAGTYEYWVDTTNFPSIVTCPASSFHTSVFNQFDSTDTDKNFALQCSPIFDIEARSVFADRFRPANATSVNLSVGDATNFYNAHCAEGVSGAVTLVITGSAHYLSPAPGAQTPIINGDTLTWNVADFGTIHSTSDFNIMVETDTTALMGSSICFTLSVTPLLGDNNTLNNIINQCFTVVNSYDPNDKTVYPAAAIDTAVEWLTYTVRYQNTGTAEAQHIYITDTLDVAIDESSFQLLAYSVRPLIEIKEKNIRFNYPNINLPDSNTNEPASHGYVQYKVKLNPNLPIGTQIHNTAFIYFDFNAPIVTNTATNTITETIEVGIVDLENLTVSIYPNPAKESITITIPQTAVGSDVAIIDLTGRKVLSTKLSTTATQFSTLTLASGVYFVAIKTAQSMVVNKLVISK